MKILNLGAYGVSEMSSEELMNVCGGGLMADIGYAIGYAVGYIGYAMLSHGDVVQSTGAAAWKI
jgi:hypothetical protein